MASALRAAASRAAKPLSPSISLRGRHCVVTGGSGALGASIATEMARAGARVTLLGRSEEKLRLALQRVLAAGPDQGSDSGNGGERNRKAAEHKYVTVGSDGSGTIDVIAAERKIDVLVNAAGIPQSSLLFKTEYEAIDRLLETNLSLTIKACKAATRSLMRTAPDACIINMSSVLGTHGGRGSSVYAASKAGVIGLTRSLATELGPLGIRVNCLVPGYIQAGMTEAVANVPIKPEQIPLGRYGDPSDVAHAAMFLATNRYANNCILNIDGGLSVGLV